ncbi:MAG: sigma-70 family RNA polymerase sigma factor [Anaerohalosphaeraceae bacterium]|nr:sigma-70 family RNA polymerase sigma factor [Anaerohalosphaeraceae bacterium]
MKNKTLNVALIIFCCIVLHISHTVIDKKCQIWYNPRDYTNIDSNNHTLHMSLFWKRDLVPLESINNGFCVADKTGPVQKIFDEHEEFIRSVISFNVRNADLVDDIYQEFFLFLLSKPLPKNIRNIRGFLYHVLTNRIKDSFRKIDRYQMKINRYAKQYDGLEKNRPEKELIETEEMEKMFRLIHKNLPANEALAIKLRYRDNCNTIEAAKVMKINPRTISRYVSVGLKKVRDIILESKEGNDDVF